MDMCDEVLGVGAALKARIATDRDTGERSDTADLNCFFT
jgi:hypothetical protein